MLRSLFIWVVLFLGIAFAQVNPLLKKGEVISDIGNTGNGQFIEVPLSTVFYAPTMHIIDNIIVYSDRLIISDDCVMDGLNHESCPLDKKECEVETQVSQGSAERREGHISCSQLSTSAYFDEILNKCVLPASSAKVCRNYPGSHYDGSRDKCVTGGQYIAPPVIQHTTRRWWNCDSCGFMPISTFLPIIKAAGGTYIKNMGQKSVGQNSVFYKISHDAKKAFSIWVDGGTVLTIHPGDYFWLGYKGLMNKSGVKSSPNVRKPYINASVNTTLYPCETGYTQIDVNGAKWCTNESLFAPSCGNRFFNQRIKNECVGDKQKYDFFAYSCPTDRNIYGNAWGVIDPGGDCGEYSLTIDTNGDGIKDRCNSPEPDAENCKRLTHSCSFNPDAVCILDEKELDYNDFTKWEVINYNNVEHKDCARYSGGSWWVVDEVKKNSVWQKCNGVPTYFLSNYVLRDGHITMEGTFKTDDPGDNDWFGFVFGFQDRGNYFLLDWSRWKNDIWRGGQKDANGAPVNGGIPLTLTKLTNNSTNIGGNMWYHRDSPPSFDVLARKDNGGWSTGQEYQIKLDITSHDIKVWIGKAGEPMTLDIDYHSDVALDVTGKLGFYNYSISRVTYRDFNIQWEDGENVTKLFKRPLENPSTLSGEYKSSEFGSLREGTCTDSDKHCLYALSVITANDNKLCLEDKTGRSGCFESLEECTFEGIISDSGIKVPPLFSFLNSSDEVISGYHSNIKKDFNSPTDISLDFTSLPTSNYLLEQVKSSASLGDKITVDFWLYWRGGKGMPVGFSIYDLWITDYLGFFKFGFNTGKGDLYGIRDIGFMKDSWHRITAVFTHGDLLQNELYIDGIKQTLSEQHSTRLTHSSERADITKSLQLSGWTANSSYSLDAKIAGFNVYDGRLTADEIGRLVSGGTIGGISKIKIGKNSISGFDADNTLLGEINSSCELSGKVGFEGKDSRELCSVVRLKPRNLISTQSIGVLYSTGNGNPIGLGTDIIWAGALPVPSSATLPKTWTSCGHPTSSPLQEIQYGDEESIPFYLSGSGANISFCDGGGSDGNWYVYKDRILESCSANEKEVVVDGNNYCEYKSFTKGVCESNLANVAPDMLETNIEAGGVIVASVYHNVKVANPITAAKIVDNRIEFWNSYENKGNSGHIEIMKKVSTKDALDGFTHEFEELTKLYSEGFTGFKTYENNMTYATSLESMDVAACSSHLAGTHYFLAERNASDLIGNKALDTFSHYQDGSFGGYCLIQRPGEYDNKHAEYAIKNTLIEKVYTAYYCSPWGCDNHKCGYAECPTDFLGTTIQPDDRARVLAETCLEQKCDITKDFFRYCGSPSGCDENDPTITKTQEGLCKQADCNGEDLFDSGTGQCEKEGCTYIKRGNKCFKKLY
jgi:hypothetical protein